MNERTFLYELLPLVAWNYPRYRMHYYKDRLEGVDIDAEYELIKAKGSKLPRALRDEIVRMKEATK